MRRRLFTPAILMTCQALFVQLAAIAIFAVQAAFLGPHAFGLVATATIFTGLCEVVFTSVVIDTLISVGRADDLHYSTALLASAGAAAAAGAAMFVASDAVAGLLHDPALSLVIKGLSPLPLLSALWAAPQAKTRREMDFATTMVRALVSLTVSGVVGVALAVAGFGVWALVWQALSHRLIGAAAMWLAVPLRFKLRFSPAHLRELGRIALPLLTARCMAWASGQAPRFLIALFLGTVDVGLYSLGARLTDVTVKLTVEPKTIVARIAFRRFQAAPDGVEREARRLFSEISLVCFPVCLGAVAIAPDLLAVWLDQRWQGALVPVQLLLCACIPYATCYGATAALLALNRRRSEALLSTLQLVSITAALCATLPRGIDAASLALPLAVSGAALPAMLMMKRACGLPMISVVAVQLPPLAAALTMATAVRLARGLDAAGPPGAARLGLLVTLGVAVYVAAVTVFAPALAFEKGRSALALARLRTQRR